MGWSGSYYAGGVKDFIKNGNVENLYRYETIAKSVKGSVVYSAIKDDKGHVSAVVTLLRKARDGYIMVKSVHEDSGPCESECPEKILNMLSVTDHEWALAWRERCRNRKGIVKECKVKRAELDALPIRSKIIVKGEEYMACGNEYRGTKAEGSTIFINTKTDRYIKKNVISASGWSVVFHPGKMKMVLCLDEYKEYYFDATNGYDALTKMLYTLNLSKRDDKAEIVRLKNTWSLVHDGKTYGALGD